MSRGAGAAKRDGLKIHWLSAFEGSNPSPCTKTQRCDNMNIKERFQRKITIKRYELNLIIITTILAVLLLINVWPRFRSDAMSFPWYAYLVLLVIFLLPFYKRLK